MIIKKFRNEAGGIKFMTFLSFRTIQSNNLRLKVVRKKQNLKYSKDLNGMEIKPFSPDFPVNSSFKLYP